MTTAATPAPAANSEGAPASIPAGKPAETPTPKPVETPASDKPAETPGSKPGEPPPAAPKPDEKPAPAARTVPEKYELKVPDGAREWLDEGVLAQLSQIARDHGLDNAGAQTLVDQHADTYAAQSAAFKAVTEGDKDYGGSNLEQTRQDAKLALDTLRPAGTPRGDALRQILARSGYGNNIEIVSLLADLGRGMREDRPATGGSPPRGDRDAATVLYDKTPAAK
jgi:hypothetical protein